MKKLGIVVFVAAFLAAFVPVPASTSPSVGDVEGAGFLRVLSCGVCVGGSVGLVVNGYGGVWGALAAWNDGALSEVCFSVCAS